MRCQERPFSLDYGTVVRELQLPSILVRYDGHKITTRMFPGRLRGLAWDREGSSLMLAGNRGRVIKLQDDRKDTTIETRTTANLRSVSVNPIDNRALVAGNAGTLIQIKNGIATTLSSSTFENLRAVRWNADGSQALIAGNNGTLINYTEKGLEVIEGGRANLRGVSWRRTSQEALVTSNCFAGEFIPSPDLFLFDAEKNTLTPMSEGRLDLIGVDWKPDGSLAVVVGYDVVWHTGFIGRLEAASLSAVPFQNAQVYPTAASWDPTGRTAAIATCITQLHSGEGRIMLWNGDALQEIYRNEHFFFSAVAWSPVGFKLAAVASTAARTFDS